MEGGDDSLRTVECLRGRLLAERQASKVARENAQIMAKKLVQLENQLREETKLRIKAEKKLHLLMKKLDSLKIHPNPSGTSTSSASLNDPLDSQVTTSTISQEIKENLPETTNSLEDTATSKDSFSESSEDPRSELAKNCGRNESGSHCHFVN